ncbi:MAG: FmdE family protein [Desulfobacterales bacterium]
MAMTSETIRDFTLDQYIEKIKDFHGHVAPGMVLGGFMVDLAYRHLPAGELFDAVCETRACLPDAIQILTPCTVGNGWLKIVNLGRYALSFFEKYSGQGIRVYVDREKLLRWPEIDTFFFKLKPKKEQDFNALTAEIVRAHTSIFGTEEVVVDLAFVRSHSRGDFAVCPLCGEGYPADDGNMCLGCRGGAPYVSPGGPKETAMPSLTAIPVEMARGRHVLHDMTRIIPGKEKGAAFKRFQEIGGGDICRLQKLGRQNVYTMEDNPIDSDWVHEDEAAGAFASAMAGTGVLHTENPSEGKVEFFAEYDGMLVIDKDLMAVFNTIPGVSCAARHGFTLVKKGDKLAGTRAIPLFLPRNDFRKAMTVLGNKTLFQVVPLRKAKAGILVTGTEVFRGLVEDRFVPIIREKVEAYGCSVIKTAIVPDDRQAISDEVTRMVGSGVDLLITTAGLSVDPDDVTRLGLLDAGVTDMLYGTPILPGNMTLIARIGKAQVMGVPGCALYHKITSLDLLLPRLLAGVAITRKDMAVMGNGGMCLDCDTCIFPRCGFGK